MKSVLSWGRLTAAVHNVVALHDVSIVPRILSSSALPGIPYGMGRSYGDQALNPGGTLWQTSRLDKFVEFDQARGRLTCESGVLLGDIQNLTVPRGWMLPVSPGTQWVTVGGAIANDVHGKNHHVMGTFGEHVLALELVRTDGELIRCSTAKNPHWFTATVGGMGLTGLITRAQLQLRRVKGPWLTAETLKFRGLPEFFQLAADSEADWEYTVAWVDCLSGARARGLFMRATHSRETAGHRKLRQRRLSMPWTPPVSLVNRFTLRAFNLAYYHQKKRQSSRQLVHYAPFLYPLDAVAHWNRMYGPKGFYQYQCVVPWPAGAGATHEMLSAIARASQGSFLAILKTFNQRPSAGLLSFPQPGVTLALDFPNRGRASQALFEQLDAIVRTAGGRIYTAKDTRMSADLFQAGYPALERFIEFRDPGISSAMSRRLLGT